MSDKPCYAPVFKPINFWACFWLMIIYTLVIAYLLIMLIIALIGGGAAVRQILCLIKQYSFRISHCRKGNDDPNQVI